MQINIKKNFCHFYLLVLGVTFDGAQGLSCIGTNASFLLVLRNTYASQKCEVLGIETFSAKCIPTGSTISLSPQKIMFSLCYYNIHK